MGKIIATCISEVKGTQKKNVHTVNLIQDFGIEGDAHAGKWHRQVSLLSWDKIEDFRKRGADVCDGAFGENLVVEGIDFRNLPIGTKRLVELIKTVISRGEFNPFYGKLYSQDGIVQEDSERELTPEEIIMMDWLADNVVGYIPDEDELVEHSLPTIKQQGIKKKGE